MNEITNPDSILDDRVWRRELIGLAMFGIFASGETGGYTKHNLALDAIGQADAIIAVEKGHGKRG